MVVKTIINSVFSSCTYIVHDSNSTSCSIVDCGDIKPILEYLKQNNLVVDKVFLTHAHFDHIYGLNDLVNIYPKCKVYTNSFGYETLLNSKLNLSKYNESDFVFIKPDAVKLVSNNDKLEFLKKSNFEVLETPGHNGSCICWFNEKIIFTGDSYIPGVKLITNLPGGCKMKGINSTKNILNLVTNRKVYAGH